MKKTRAFIDENKFKQVKELQVMGASASKTAKFVAISPATAARMYNATSYEAYREHVREISNGWKSKPLFNDSNKGNVPVKDLEPNPSEIQDLTNAIVRLAEAIEQKKKGFF